MITVDRVRPPVNTDRGEPSDIPPQTCNGCGSTTLKVSITVENPAARRDAVKHAHANGTPTELIAASLSHTTTVTLCPECTGKLTAILEAFKASDRMLQGADVDDRPTRKRGPKARR